MAAKLPPFSRLLVPYDGSEPARSALAVALSLTGGGASLTILTVVNEMSAVTQAESSSMVPFDPTPLTDALEAEGTTIMNDAVQRCRTAGVTPATEITDEFPVAGIIAAIAKHKIDLVVMGTHARSGVARTFLGSTAEGTLRLSSVPVLTVRTVDHIGFPFTSALVAVDNSESTDAALAVAARLAQVAGTQLIACHAVDLAPLYANADGYGVDIEQLSSEMHEDAADILKRALERASLPPTTPTAIVDGDPTDAIIKEAATRGVTTIITGSHGRRGLRRFFLGSTAESIVRNAEVPVLVVPGKHQV